LNMNYTKTLKIKFEGVEANFGDVEDFIIFHKLKLKEFKYNKQLQGISIEYLVLLYLASDQNDQKLSIATEFIRNFNFNTQEKDKDDFKLSDWNSFFITGDTPLVHLFTTFIRQYLHEYRFGFGFTVLHHLCCHKNTSAVIECLINDKIVNVNEIDKFGNTPLFYSERYKHNQISKMLKQKGANENILNFEKKSIKEYVNEKGFEQ
jgi:ankyrin repeat protein